MALETVCIEAIVYVTVALLLCAAIWALQRWQRNPVAEYRRLRELYRTESESMEA